MSNEDFYVSQALSVIAQQGKPVKLDHSVADYMGLAFDPAVSETDFELGM